MRLFWEAREKPNRFGMVSIVDFGFRIFKRIKLLFKLHHIEILNFGYWDLFDICDLLFGVYYGPALHTIYDPIQFNSMDRHLLTTEEWIDDRAKTR